MPSLNKKSYLRGAFMYLGDETKAEIESQDNGCIFPLGLPTQVRDIRMVSGEGDLEWTSQ